MKLFVVGQVVSNEVDNVLFFQLFKSVFLFDDRCNQIVSRGIGNRHNGSELNAVHRLNHIFDLGRVDVMAAVLENVFLAINHINEASLVNVTDVACLDEAIWVDSVFCFPRVVVVTLKKKKTFDGCAMKNSIELMNEPETG